MVVDGVEHRMEGQATGQLLAPGAEHRRPGRNGPARPGGQQPGLAHARLALDHDKTAMAGLGPGQGGVERGEGGAPGG